MGDRLDVCTAAAKIEAAFPPGPEREEILALVRMGAKFRMQQRGRRPGILARTLLEIARTAEGAICFENMLDELEAAAARRALHGETVSPIEKVDRVWELVTYHDPRRGRIQATFKTVRNLVTFCRKNLAA